MSGDNRPYRGADQGGGGSQSGHRHFRAGAPPKDVIGWAIAAIAVGAFVSAASWATLADVRRAALSLEVGGWLVDSSLLLLGLASLVLIVPAGRSLRLAVDAR